MSSRLQDVLLIDTRANQPLATDVANGTLYSVSDEDFLIEQSDGSAWSQWGPTPSAGGGITSLTSDVTATGPGAAAATIANDAVTYAKMQDVSAASRLLGRGTAGTSDVREISLDSTLAFTGDVLGTVGSSSSAWTSVFKVTNTSRVNNTLAADPDLVFPMVANKIYTFKMRAYWVSSGNPDFKYRTAGPASPTRVSILRATVAPNVAAWAVDVDEAYSAADIVISAFGTSNGYIEIAGSIANGANAGNFEFQWAQNVTDAAFPTTMYAGSFLEYRQVD